MALLMGRLSAARHFPRTRHAKEVCRSFAGSGGTGDTVKVFDRTAKRRQRDRAAAADPTGEYDYLREHIASVLVDRIEVMIIAVPCTTGGVLRSLDYLAQKTAA